MMISRPKIASEYYDREIDCQMSIEDAMIELLGRATVAGWTRAEVLVAMVQVADNTAKVHGESEAMERRIQQLSV